MKILMMTNTYTPVIGGVEESIQTCTDYFRRQGHQVFIVAPEFKNMPENEEGVLRIPAIQEFNHSDFSVNLPIPGLLSKLVKDFKPDVVHSHHPFLVGDMALRLCGQYGIPLVFTYHTMFEDYLHYLPFQGDHIKRFVIELSSGYANLTDQVIVPSRSVEQILKKRAVDVPMTIIPTGVDMKKFGDGDGAKVRKQLEIPEKAFVVGNLGRLSQEKNLEFLSRSVADFIKKKEDVHFLVVGKGPQEKAIKDIFDKDGLADRLHLAGALQGQPVVDAYHAMDLFAFASHTETQGIVLNEAMAASLPVVAIDAPGVREIVVDGKNGRLIPREEQAMFGEALSWCYNRDREEFQDLKRGAWESANVYSVDRCAKEVLEIYSTVKSKKYMLSEKKHGIWTNVMNRIKTEWDMAMNIVEASEAALHLSRSDSTGTEGGSSLAHQHQKSWIIRIKRWLSRKEWSAKLLDLEQSQATEAHPGLVMIQIDGLSRTQFTRALERGKMPFLDRLIKAQHYKVQRMYTGLPSSTPSVQGELFYGVKQVVPGFSFYDPKKDKFFRMYKRFAVEEIEKGLAGNSDEKGLLDGGSSYSNVYSGGAIETHFCAVKIGWDMFWRGVNPFKIVLLWITHLYDFLRMTVLVVIETIWAVVDFMFVMLIGESFRKELKFIPTRSFICILLRELVTLGARMDIARGLPIVHMNFLGYDEQAHRRGPSSKFAHRALPGIDREIAKIYRQAMHSTRRDYDVWVYSDHGQEDALSYAMQYRKTAKKAIKEIYEEMFNRSTEKSAGRVDLTLTKHARKEDDQEGVEAHRARYLGGWFVKSMFSFMGISDDKEEEEEKSEAGEIVVTAIGPTGNIYLPRAFSVKERDQFAQKIVSEAHIPVVLAPDGPNKARVWNEEGRFHLPEDAATIIGKDHPYLKEVTADLIKMCHHPQGGDFTIMGWCPGKTPVTFPMENGAHAGPGIEETNAFALLPPDICLRDDEEHLTTQDLRAAALKVLGRPREEKSPLTVKRETSENLTTKETLRVMTYNVHSCKGMDGKISPERIARVISRHEPDIVALQELDLRKKRTGGMDQTHIIAKELEMIYHFHSNIRVEEEHYGSAVLSRYPMRLVKAGKIPGLAHKPNIEPRGAIWCAIDIGGNELQFINAHLGLRSEERLRQVKALCGSEWIGHPDCWEPVILSGDFNALPGSPACRYLRRVLRDSQIALQGHSPRATWFSHLPMGRIDHVFVSSDIEVKWIEVSNTDLDKKSSDHLPLIVDVRLPIA